MYVSPERVIRNGRLVAYKGEQMVDAEAKRRDLLPQPEPAIEPEPVTEPAEQPKPKRKRRK